MRKIIALLGAGALLLSIVPATLAASVVVPPSKSSGTIVSIAESDPRFDTLYAAVVCADPAVAAALTSGDQYTVFAPTDDAFAGIGLNPGNVCNRAVISQANLTKVLLYHVTDGRRFSNSVLPKTSNPKTISTLLGQSFKVDGSGGITTTSGKTDPSIIIANIPATNGVIHAVNAVLLPNL